MSNEITLRDHFAAALPSPEQMLEAVDLDNAEGVERQVKSASWSVDHASKLAMEIGSLRVALKKALTSMQAGPDAVTAYLAEMAGLVAKFQMEGS